MTKDEISKIKEHIEIHFRREPRAVKITEILWRAVGELEHIAELEKENTGLKLKLEALEGETPWKDIKDKSELIKENAELKALLNCNNCYELSEEECEVCAEYSHFKCKRKDQLTKAKNLIENIIRVTWNSGWSYSLDWKVKAEQYLKDLEK